MSADDLNMSGNLQRGLNQAELDARYNEFMREQDQPYTNLAASTSAISGVPVLINSSGTRTSQQKLGLGDALGYFANLAAVMLEAGADNGLYTGRKTNIYF